MSENTLTTVELQQQSDYQFQIQFGPNIAPLLGDEPPPLGQGAGPTPAQLLAAAVGNCLSDSLLFALRKFKQAPEPIQCRVQAEIGRSPDGHLRVLRMQATLQLGVPQSQLQHLDRVLDQFESFCTVTQSVRAAIPITVEVLDADGRRLK